ncbi:MAG: hypothetical protein QM487_14410 [Candidatus Marithrix sp.]
MRKILLIVVCTAITFYLGRASKNIDVKGSTIFNSEEAFVKAEALLEKGELTTAGLYFNNGLSQEPGNWEKIHRYQQNIIKYCQRLIANDEYEIVLNLLDDMDTFMRSQALHILVSDIDKLQLVLVDIAKLKQSVVKKVNFASSSEKNTTITALVKQTEQFINKAKLEPIQSNFIMYYLTSADSIISQLVLSAPKITKPQIAKLVKQLEQAKQEISNRQSKIVWNDIHKAYAELEINKVGRIKNDIVQLTKTKQILIKQRKSLITKGKLSEKLQKMLADEILIGIEQIKIDLKKMNLKVKNNGFIKAKNAIKELITFRQLLVGNMNKISSVEFLEKIQILAKEVNNAIIKWQQIQSRRYEKWAINRITIFYDSYKQELGINSDEDKIYKGIVALLGNIDIRYLSSPAQTAYNEAFQKFYVELRDNQKIPLSAEMTLMNKKLLSDF